MRTRFLVLSAIVVLGMLGLAELASAGGNSAAAMLCQHGGWQSLQSEAGSTFAGQSECVAYAAHGGRFKQVISVASGGGGDMSPGSFWVPAPIATSGLPVTISIDSGSAGVCQVSGEFVDFDSPGFCLVDFTQ